MILATGGVPYTPDLESMGGLPVVHATEILNGEKQVRGSAVVADWRCDWVGMGIAMHLAQNGCSVRLAVNGLVPGETVPVHVRDHANGELRKLGVEVIPYTRLYGYDDNTVCLHDTVTGAPVILENADALVLAYGTSARSDLGRELDGYASDMRIIGDYLTPRTTEDAVYDGFKVALEL